MPPRKGGKGRRHSVQCSTSSRSPTPTASEQPSLPVVLNPPPQIPAAATAAGVAAGTPLPAVAEAQAAPTASSPNVGTPVVLQRMQDLLSEEDLAASDRTHGSGGSFTTATTPQKKAREGEEPSPSPPQPDASPAPVAPPAATEEAPAAEAATAAAKAPAPEGRRIQFVEPTAEDFISAPRYSNSREAPPSAPRRGGGPVAAVLRQLLLQLAKAWRHAHHESWSAKLSLFCDVLVLFLGVLAGLATVRRKLVK